MVKSSKRVNQVTLQAQYNLQIMLEIVFPTARTYGVIAISPTQTLQNHVSLSNARITFWFVTRSMCDKHMHTDSPVSEPNQDLYQNLTVKDVW